MEQPSEIPENLTASVVLPLPGIETAQLSSGKRRWEDLFQTPAAVAGGEGEEVPKKRAKSLDVLFRIVVPSKQIGKVIGIEGCRIQKIREATKATIKIADAIVVSLSPIFRFGF